MLAIDHQHWDGQSLDKAAPGAFLPTRDASEQEEVQSADDHQTKRFASTSWLKIKNPEYSEMERRRQLIRGSARPSPAQTATEGPELRLA
jgi:hypothetical protein